MSFSSTSHIFWGVPLQHRVCLRSSIFSVALFSGPGDRRRSTSYNDVDGGRFALLCLDTNQRITMRKDAKRRTTMRQRTGEARRRTPDMDAMAMPRLLRGMCRLMLPPAVSIARKTLWPRNCKKHEETGCNVMSNNFVKNTTSIVESG